MEAVMSTLMQWNPFTELEDLRHRLSRLMGEAQGRRADDVPSLFADWSPAVDIQETETAYLVKADLPEVKKDDIKVELHDGTLSIQGERRQEKEEKGKRFRRTERLYGQFMRRFALPDAVEASSVKAEFRDGVLTVTLPKATSGANKPTQVKIA
jgi:HSP20 family protein